MFHVTVDGITYKVYFEHDRNEGIFYTGKHWVKTIGRTFCYVDFITKDSDGHSRHAAFAKTVAYCSHKDNFSKDKGRKVALAKMLKSSFPREHRKLFWDAYFRMSPLKGRTERRTEPERTHCLWQYDVGINRYRTECGSVVAVRVAKRLTCLKCGKPITYDGAV